MSDEIDIEEHDLMENPTIKRIFPDLSVIKKEINQYYEEDVQLDTTLEQPIPETIKSSNTGTPIQTEKQEDILCINQLIKFEETPKEPSHLNDNVIILGSKPVSNPEKIHHCVKLTQEPKLILDNVGYFLNTCKRYCKLCLRLFPKAHSYNIHMYIAHTIKIGQRKPNQLKSMGKKLSNQSYKCNNCNMTLSSRFTLMRHFNKFHSNVNKTNPIISSNNKVTSSENTTRSKTATGHSCFHCKLLFPSQSSLIEHLYDVLKPKTEGSSNDIGSSINAKNTSKTEQVLKPITGGSRNPIRNKTNAKNTNEETEYDSNEGNTLKRKNVSKRKSSIDFIENKKEPKLQENIKEPTGFKNIIASSSNNKNNIDKCVTCTAQFNSREKLKYHIDSVHKRSKTKIRKRKSKLSSMNKLYKCSVCSKYTLSFKYYSIHMRTDHKMKEVPDVQKVKFDSKCKYCYSIMSTTKIYNTHLAKYHRKQMKLVILPDEMERVKNEKENSFAIKSVLYKCMKCGIFFLSANVAMNHSKHKEMLSNWKCSICQRMFKKQNRDLHIKQHSFSKKFAVYSLSESEFGRILYKCLQCTVHYSEENFLAHHLKCDSETPNSVYCKVCDILINKDDMEFHQLNHKDKNVQCTDFTIIESDIIDEHSKIPLREYNEKDEENINDKNRSIGSTQSRTTFDVAYCHTCNCFLTSYTSKSLKEHTQGKCGHISKIICKDCGLVLTMTTYEKHKELHKRKEYNLQNFLFYEVNSKKPISPSIPDYPNCNVCGVHFLSKNAIQTHSCQLQEYKTCNICLIKLTEQAYKLHMAFHRYLAEFPVNDKKLTELTSSNDNSNNTTNKKISCSSRTKRTKKYIKVNDETGKSKFIFLFCRTCKCFVSNYQSRIVHLEAKCSHIPTLICQGCGLLMTWKTHSTHKQLHKKMEVNIQQYFFYELHTKKQICPPITDFPNCNVCGVHFLRKNRIRTHSCQLQEYETCNICLIKLTQQAYKLHMDFHNYSITNTNRKMEHATVDLPTNNTPDLVSHNTEDSYLKNTLLFSCKSCQITLITYEKVVQHCQDHYNHKVTLLNIQKCEYCNLTFCKKDYDEHNKLHINGEYNNETIKTVEFDPLYFRYSCDFWTKHIFAYVADDQITAILDNSMYKYECRLKMEEIQSGSPNLTLYKCDKCQAFIEPQSLYMHAKNSKYRSCVNLRKHTCSLCSLTFVSLSYRLAHEKEHEGMDKKIQSYRILLFNKDDETMFDAGKRFIVYQCRNCDMIVDKFKRKDHQCVVNDLKKCSDCGLVIHSLDYDLHFIRHEEILQFNKENITVVMFGKINCLWKKEFRSTFKGIIYDYTFYKCKNCKLCIQTKYYPPGHVCVNDDSKFMCTKCELWFLRLDMKEHSKLHDSNLEFDELNLNVITFDPLSMKINSVCPETVKVQDDSIKAIEDKNVITSKSKQNDNNDPEKLDKIYKCVCGLHFLEELNAQQHAHNCNAKMKISKQSCFKCDLLFTPGELFNHLLKHHCDKKLQYKFDIIIVYKKTAESNVTV